METVADSKPASTTALLPARTHPNYRLWANYARFAQSRGRMVAKIVASHGRLSQLEILDLGCGAGGTTIALAQSGAGVTAVDPNPDKVRRLRQVTQAAGLQVEVRTGDAATLDFADEAFDWVILQDVLEHLQSPKRALREVRRVLKPGGKLYVSTPNRWSPLTLVSDPHWNLPIVACLSRPAVEFFITKLTRRERAIREDFGVLLSLWRLRALFRKHNFTIRMINLTIVQELFRRPTSVVNSDLHLRIVKYLSKLRLQKLVAAVVNDRPGIFNHVVNPTWYLVATKQDSSASPPAPAPGRAAPTHTPETLRFPGDARNTR